MKGVYAHLVNRNFNFVSIRNDTDSPLVISRYYRISLVIEYEAEEGYPIDVENYSLAAKATEESASLLGEFTDLLTLRSAIKKISLTPSLETKLSNEITIYRK